MDWNQIREHNSIQWGLVEEIEAHSAAGRCLLDELTVEQEYPSGEEVMQGCLDLHRRSPEREPHVLHTERPVLDVGERERLGRMKVRSTGSRQSVSTGVPHAPPARLFVLMAAAVVLVATTLSCSKPPAPEGYTPGLGEIMTLNQMRHVKLWYAGDAGNWPLAAYELDELREGFADAVRYHPTHKDSPLPIAELVPKIMDYPLGQLDQAIQAHDHEAFVRAFDQVTAACNHCHQAASFGFNVVRRPTANTFTNQDFQPAR